MTDTLAAHRRDFALRPDPDSPEGVARHARYLAEQERKRLARATGAVVIHRTAWCPVCDQIVPPVPLGQDFESTMAVCAGCAGQARRTA